MNFIEACKLLQLDENVKLIRRNDKDFQITLDASGKFLVNIKTKDGAFIPTIEEILAEDWYVIKNTKYHTFEEAITALKSGKVIKRDNWTEKVIERDFCDDYSIAFTIDDFEANDWIIVGE